MVQKQITSVNQWQVHHDVNKVYVRVVVVVPFRTDKIDTSLPPAMSHVQVQVLRNKRRDTTLQPCRMFKFKLKFYETKGGAASDTTAHDLSPPPLPNSTAPRPGTASIMAAEPARDAIYLSRQ